MNLLPFLVLLALCACSGGGPEETPRGTSLFSGFSISETDSNAARWRLDAPTASMEDLEGRMAFSEPVIQFYDKNNVSSVIKARSGLLEPSKKSAVLSTDVSVNAIKDGMLLKTEKLYYSSSKGKIWTDEKVTLIRGKTVIKGKGFTANPDLSEIEIEHQETKITGK
ncbi:MAG TPA: LPS export ABC transporter periplasmic protein LptC [Elusimicrobia bacterium]|nr:LPS export ABC transporter periplasmic protein LptC [Elusimicrobiota bacterium]